MKEEIAHDGKVIAIVIRKSFQKSGINFVSEKDFPLQLGVNSYKKGESIKPHSHLNKKLTINKIQEVVHFESGKATVTLYDADGNKFRTLELSEGDTIFFVEGGHGFTMLEDTKIMEVKQGPYFGKDKDKVLIE